MKKCPYCSEDIQEDAKKCKHCGEWLNGSKPIYPAADNGSSAARAISKGIKQKELQDFNVGILGAGALILSCAIGFLLSSFWVGLIVFVVLGYLIGKQYYKE